ncbi:MAG: sulfurtransferase TusA family protein [Gammaproteobacteria bacterium]
MNDIVPSLPVTTVLDVKGLKCPMPLLKTKVELNRIQPGQILRVLATDPMAVVDLRAFCLRSGHEMLRWAECGPVWEFFIRKAASDS